jgi:hypothetical protein
MRLILLIILLLLVLGALPTWPYSARWGILSFRRAWPDSCRPFDPAPGWQNLAATELQLLCLRS